MKLVMIATVCISGLILSSLLLLLLSSLNVVYGQTPDQALSSPSPSEQQSPGSAAPPSPTSPFGQTPDQALSSPSPSISPNQATGQPQEEQPQAPSSSSPIPGLLFPPQQQLPSPQQQPSPLRQSPLLQQQPPSPPAKPVAPITQTTANGTIDSLIFAPGTRWIATGNWTLILLSGNVNSFSTNMTWYNNNGTGTHTHELLNFKSNPIDVTVKPGNNVLVKGLMDVGTNHRITWTSVHSTIDIKGGKTIAISLDDKETNKHFAAQTIYGIVKSFIRCSDQPGENMEVLEPCTSSSPSSSSS